MCPWSSAAAKGQQGRRTWTHWKYQNGLFLDADLGSNQAAVCLDFQDIDASLE